MKTFSQSVVLITGASSGLGAEFAKQLAPQAKTLILVARRRDRLESLRDELQRAVPSRELDIQLHCFDLTDAAATEQFLRQLAAGDRRISLLINNAGVGDHGLFEKSDWPRVEQMLILNIVALTRLTQALLPDLIRSRGAILNVSSVASLLPLPGFGVYAASKAYVTSFSEALRAELRDHGVSVTALCPGPVSTEFFQFAQRPGSDEQPSAGLELLKVPAAQVVATGLRAVLRDRPRVIPGWFTSFFMTSVSLLPLWMVRVTLRPRSGRQTGA